MTYDQWKLASPPEYDRRDTCPACGEQEGFAGDSCAACDWTADDEPEGQYDTLEEARGER